MKIPNNYIKIFVISSIVFMQASSTFAAVFSLNNDNYIQICTAVGIKLVSTDDLKSNNDSNYKTELMSCCLDVHSNFLVRNDGFNKPKYLRNFNVSNKKDISKIFFLKNKIYIRGPPNLV